MICVTTFHFFAFVLFQARPNLSESMQGISYALIEIIIFLRKELWRIHWEISIQDAIFRIQRTLHYSTYAKHGLWRIAHQRDRIRDQQSNWHSLFILLTLCYSFSVRAVTNTTKTTSLSLYPRSIWPKSNQTKMNVLEHPSFFLLYVCT
jgi:hypothetical protein